MLSVCGFKLEIYAFDIKMVYEAHAGVLLQIILYSGTLVYDGSDMCQTHFHIKHK